jgi:demethoxyubiquinone hydroxylase (CLK1/Coq7/Cat5 family)
MVVFLLQKLLHDSFHVQETLQFYRIFVLTKSKIFWLIQKRGTFRISEIKHDAYIQVKKAYQNRYGARLSSQLKMACRIAMQVVCT